MLEYLKSFFVKKEEKTSKKIQKKEIFFNDISLKVLDENQQKLKPLLEEFSIDYFLAWWTAVALQIWHRKSIDFDFFWDNKISFAEFIKIISKYWFEVSKDDKKNYAWIEFEKQDDINVNILWVKFSLINYFRTLYDNQSINIKWESYILNWLKIASLQELACMKAFAMISRKKWKDAVDLYFLLKKLDTDLKNIINLCENKYFINIFNHEAVYEQILSLDWDKTEKVDYIIENPPKDEEIEDFLVKEVLEILKKVN